MRNTKAFRKLKKTKRILAQEAQKGKRMKKYRLTKITVKTREIISMPKNSATEHHGAVCPVCHAVLPASFPANESSAGLINAAKQSAELPPAKKIDGTTTKDYFKEI